jgi:uncharacterized protein (TIGR03435 family)
LCISGCGAPIQAQDRQVKFEIISIRPNHTGSMNMSSGPTKSGYTATNVPLSRVIAESYMVATNSELVPPVDWVRNAPGWVMNDRYDIIAKADDAGIEAMKDMTKMQRSRDNSGTSRDALGQV